MTVVIAVMARYPYGGSVKTRLGAQLSESARAELYEAFLADTLRQLNTVPNVARALVHAAPERADWFRRLLQRHAQAPENVLLVPQREGMLGERVVGAFEDLFAAHDRVLLTGSDSPNLPAEYLHRAARALETGAELVIGPAEDGGYYCVGLHRPTAHLFDRIEWSTERTRAQTLAAAEALGLAVALTPTWYDVDRPEDLARLERDIAPCAGAQAPRTWAVLQQLRVNETSSLRAPCAVPESTR